VTRRHPIFVVQKHDATTLHYDFRLEIGGTLASWAVPKGPSLDPRDKRLAMRVEDHSLGYADFEGVIAEGQYGAGPVIVWDTGAVQPLGDEPLEKQLAGGHVKFRLEGEKLRGGFSLRRWGSNKDGREKWLLMKIDDEEADRRRKPVVSRPESVLSGRTIEEVAAGR
jgi:DNA ligase D-like protein (predicted 3'-phosphoesterase)